ncbi:MAG: bifunctional hydroxymethylpyrimidine kinase/phosphomethylpyrimidine kinase [Campylobacterales bacterium]
MKTVLSIAGSDSGGGAGIQADLKTFEYFGVFGTTAITALTAQNTCGVQGVYPGESSFVQKQIESILDDFDIKAIKIGMLFSAQIIKTTREILEQANNKIPIVLDTVAVTNTGDRLLEDSALEELKALLPLATLITPNRKELQLLLDKDSAVDANYIYTKCFDIRKKLGVDVLAKNFKESGNSADYLLQKEGLKKYGSRFIDSKNTHGTGCTYSSAIAANLALGLSLDESIKKSKQYIESAIEYAPNIGKCGGPIRHNLLKK